MKSKVGAGLIAGLIGAIISGIVMQCCAVSSDFGSLSMMDLNGKLLGNTSLVVGWLNTIVSGGILGMIFGGWLGARCINMRASIIQGLLYGLGLWFVGGLILEPLMLKTAVFAFTSTFAWLALLSYLVYGLFMGACFPGIYKPGVVQSVRDFGERVGAGRM
jgi:hypothetical protein